MSEVRYATAWVVVSGSGATLKECWTYLILTHEARRICYLTENFDVRDILAGDHESVEEVRDNRLLKCLATIFPGAVGEAVGAIGVHEDTPVTTTHK